MIDPLTHVPVAAGPAYAEQVRELPSRFSATLVSEDQNRFNRFAVAVLVEGKKIGYLPPEIACHYFEPLRRAPAPVECPARRAPAAEHEDTGVDVLLDLSTVAREE